MAAVAASVILAVGVAIDHHAHGWWTYTRSYDERLGVYVCSAENPNYRVVGIDTRRPMLDFPAMGVAPEDADDGTLIWRVGYSVGHYIDEGFLDRNMNIRWSNRHGVWRWNGVPWALIDSHGGVGRRFAIQWHTPDGAPAVTEIHFDGIMSAYDWVVACQQGDTIRSPGLERYSLDAEPALNP